MSMDKRIETNYQPMYGCHSYFDKYRTEKHEMCDVKHDYDTGNERACSGCEYKKDAE